MTSPANWYPDPMGRFQLRYFDGTIWTDHVSNNGASYLDPLNPTPQPAAEVAPVEPQQHVAPQQVTPQQVVEHHVTPEQHVAPQQVVPTVEPAPAPQPVAEQHLAPEQQIAPQQVMPMAAPTQAPIQAQQQPAGHVQTSATPEKIQAQVQGDGWRGAGIAPAATGGGTLFTEPVIVVNQKAKIFELTNQYAVFDAAGNQLGSMTQVGQSGAKKVLRAVSSLDQFMTHNLEIRDNAGQVVMSVTRPRKVFKSTVIVTAPNGGEIGKIVQENVFGKIHFALMVGEQQIGSIRAENWRAWNFSIQDSAGTEVARITKTFEGVLKTMFTTADNYVLQIHYQLPQPLLALVVASALSVDTALKQDSRAF
jgi:uncharacterized protein YxjI